MTNFLINKMKAMAVAVALVAAAMPADAQLYAYKGVAAKSWTASQNGYFHAGTANNWSFDFSDTGSYDASMDVSDIDSISTVKPVPVFADAISFGTQGGAKVDLSQWKMTWNDEFNEPDSDLTDNWISQNSDVSTTIACGRWRENCLISDGTLKLMNKGPKEGYPSPYTSGNVWSKKQFQYGYFECRYRYAAAPATNNSFWFMATSGSPRFEIDINEGHYPSEITTNIHNHSVSPMTSSGTVYNVVCSYRHSYVAQDKANPLVTSKIRFSAVNGGNKFHIPEFRIYNVNEAGYPQPESATADKDVAGLVNYAKTATITCSGSYSTSTAAYPVSQIVDGNIAKHWISQVDGDKWVEFDWAAPKTIGCIQFLNGWQSGTTWKDLLSDYKIEYYTGSEWRTLVSFDAASEMNLAKEYHTYGLEWNADSLIWYFDRQEIRRAANTICTGPSPIWLSEAILPWLNPVASEIIGTQMEVDYVRAYEKK